MVQLSFVGDDYSKRHLIVEKHYACMYKRNPLSKNPVLPANIKFELEAVLSVHVVFQHQRVTGGLHCIILNYEARLCYYNDDISSNSQAVRNTGTRCYCW